jgi:hypothetical protein
LPKNLISFLFFLILGEILFEVLKEQISFELLNFFQKDFEVVKKYFFDNVFIFWLEVPKFLSLSLFLILRISSAVILLVIKNFKIYKNKIKNLYQWFLRQKLLHFHFNFHSRWQFQMDKRVDCLVGGIYDID